ncbi:hypothetical protein PIB30_096151 [Stylosanthes scabra]|uniref:Uncharacterized protein n=1 Tax=Stylosanthes scabra TaxID=79078 RepID=A0ABU6QWP0_9FABA|nr:hypothetical protein [Stylosanthes scabra]
MAHVWSTFGTWFKRELVSLDEAWVILIESHLGHVGKHSGTIAPPRAPDVAPAEDTNWADDPTVDTIPNPLDHAILNAHASAWHKVIMANVDPKTHGTTFDMSHALLIYVLMTEGVVSLPRIMRDILLTRPMKHSRHLLPYPVFISRLASECRIPEYPGMSFTWCAR